MKLAKNFLLILSLFVSVIGLVLIYFASLNIDPKKTTISDITADMEGRKISVTGYLVQKRETKEGHLFLTVSDNKSTIQVPVFSDLTKSLAQNGITSKDFHTKDKLSVKGTVEIYKGSLQIVPKKPADIKILGE